MTNPNDSTAPAASTASQRVEIMVRKNGSLRITGDFVLVDHEGMEIPRPADKPTVALCRCGQSLKKPFCDGAHKTCGFFDPPEAPAVSA